MNGYLPNEESGGFIITSKDGKSRRSDGLPLTDYDRAILAGRDPIAEQLCEMTDESLTELTREIMQQGYDEETASHYAALIGDTPCTDEAGNIVVFDGKKEIARLKLKYFDLD